MKIGIAIDAWKLPIFDKHLTKDGYVYKKQEFLPGTLMLEVYADNSVPLAHLVDKANKECAMLKGADKNGRH